MPFKKKYKIQNKKENFMNFLYAPEIFYLFLVMHISHNFLFFKDILVILHGF